MSKQRILIVDDDENIAELISLYLTKECFETSMVHDGATVMDAFHAFKPDLILLDLMLPGKDGYQLCREIRAESSVPIMMLSAKGEVFDKVLGLELGADDYMIKPFDNKEMVARVKAILRRTAAAAAPEDETAEQSQVVTLPDLVVSLSNYSVTYMDTPLYMTAREIEILYLLASNPNQVFTREQLLDRLWGYDYVGDSRTVDVYIKRLRKKLPDHPNGRLSTVWGVGYRFEVNK